MKQNLNFIKDGHTINVNLVDI